MEDWRESRKLFTKLLNLSQNNLDYYFVMGGESEREVN